MKLVEQIACAVGRHDWHFDRTRAGRVSEEFLDGSHVNPGLSVLTCWVPGVMLPVIGIIVAVAVCSVGGPHEVSLIGLGLVGLGLTLLWAIDALERHRNWVDATCIRCGKSRLELTERERQESKARRYFESLREIARAEAEK